jgi:hypothetical protein
MGPAPNRDQHLSDEGGQGPQQGKDRSEHRQAAGPVKSG